MKYRFVCILSPIESIEVSEPIYWITNSPICAHDNWLPPNIKLNTNIVVPRVISKRCWGNLIRIYENITLKLVSLKVLEFYFFGRII